MELSELPQPLFSLLRRRHLRRAGLRLVLRARGALKQPRSAAGRKKGRQPVPQPPRRGLTPSPRSPKLPRADTAAAIPHCKHFRFRPSTTFRFLPRHVSQGLSSSAPRRAGGISAAAGSGRAAGSSAEERRFLPLRLGQGRDLEGDPKVPAVLQAPSDCGQAA